MCDSAKNKFGKLNFISCYSASRIPQVVSRKLIRRQKKKRKKEKNDRNLHYVTFSYQEKIGNSRYIFLYDYNL